MDHELKIEAPHWHALKDGRKTWEARKNDRDFQVGDTLRLRPYDRARKVYLDEGDLFFVVTHVQDYGMAEGYVGLSLARRSGVRKPFTLKVCSCGCTDHDAKGQCVAGCHGLDHIFKPAKVAIEGHGTAQVAGKRRDVSSEPPFTPESKEESK